MTLVACAILLIGIFAYVFWPERHATAQTTKTQLEYLRERKDALYDNLKDLNFEYRSGKYPEDDYNAQRATLENEAAVVLRELDVQEANALRQP
jgi:cbb3-type cytochrome oxidase subunit 3